MSLIFQLISPLGTNTTIGGLNGLIEDVLALLPQDEIFILFFEKLDSSPKFATFVQSIGDANFHRKYLTLWVSRQLYRFTKKHNSLILYVCCSCAPYRNRKISIRLVHSSKSTKLMQSKSSKSSRDSSYWEHSKPPPPLPSIPIIWSFKTCSNIHCTIFAVDK